MAKPVKKKAVRKPKSKASDCEIVEKRAKAYADIATSLFDCSDQGLFVFAVGHLEEMLLELRKRYYAEEFRS
jgi:hypothetical protein